MGAQNEERGSARNQQQFYSTIRKSVGHPASRVEGQDRAARGERTKEDRLKESLIDSDYLWSVLTDCELRLAEGCKIEKGEKESYKSLERKHEIWKKRLMSFRDLVARAIKLYGAHENYE